MNGVFVVLTAGISLCVSPTSVFVDCSSEMLDSDLSLSCLILPLLKLSSSCNIFNDVTMLLEVGSFDALPLKVCFSDVLSLISSNSGIMIGWLSSDTASGRCGLLVIKGDLVPEAELALYTG